MSHRDSPVIALISYPDPIDYRSVIRRHMEKQTDMNAELRTRSNSLHSLRSAAITGLEQYER